MATSAGVYVTGKAWAANRAGRGKVFRIWAVSAGTAPTPVSLPPRFRLTTVRATTQQEPLRLLLLLFFTRRQTGSHAGVARGTRKYAIPKVRQCVYAKIFISISRTHSPISHHVGIDARKFPERVRLRRNICKYIAAH